MASARWMRDALDLTADPGKASDYLTVGQLSDATGLSDGTLLDSITRPEITVAENPRSALCRPAARIGRLPLWSKEQLENFLTLREESEEAKNVIRKLEAITATEARERGLYSIIELAEMFKLHDQTLRRGQSQDGTFPRAVARRRKNVPGVPEHLFELTAMIKWMRSKGYEIPETLMVPQS